jgi:acid phosphatase family membrane protein YuiD
MDFLLDAYRNYLFLLPLTTLFLCEIAKSLVESARTGSWHEPLFRPGGMPSSHSAFVTSLLIVVGHRLSPRSPEFAIAVVFACVMWYDAMSSRRAIGEQAVALNALQKKKKFAERLGHTFPQVVAGIAFGVVVTMIGAWVIGL